MLTLSIDANFGLCRKKSAGSSVHPPLSGSSMFLNQEEVDEYVCQYSTHPTCSTEVSEVIILCLHTYYLTSGMQ